MSDALYHGRRFRTLNVLDEGVREALDIVIDTSIPGARVVRTLDRIVDWRGKPDRMLSVSTTGPNTSRKSSQNGAKCTASNLTTYSRVNPIRMRTSSASIGRTDMKC
jgi:hypothetical protein